ncbi:MAG: efflux RND transporter periplasmic adaptor subunit [Planctomycetota bacterium]|jgi:membrane fusion protein (multidrug efflux system)
MSSQTQTGKTSPEGRNGLGKRLMAVGIVLAGLAAVVGLALLLPQRSDKEAPSAPPPVNIKVMPIEPIPHLAETFDLYGVVEPNRVVEVAAEVAGRIERLGVRNGTAAIREGDTVRAGQELALLNTDLLQAEYDQAKAQAQFDRREWQRITSAERSGAATPTERDRARTAMDTSQARFALADARLKRARIISPADGVLDALPVEVGEYVQVGSCVARVVDTATVKVVLDVPERDVQFLKCGRKERIFLDAPAAGKLFGSISFISELADERTRTSRVEITVDNRDRILRAGRIVRVRLSRQDLPNVVMIPLRAVIPTEKGKAVYVEVDGKAQRREVELGFIKGWSVQVLEGLSAGDRLIVEGFRYVSPDQPVRVVSVESGGSTRMALGDEDLEDAP